MFRARVTTVLEQSMIDGGIDTKIGIGRHFLKRLQQAGYSQDKVKVNLYSNEARIVYLATLTIDSTQDSIAKVWRDSIRQKNKWHIGIDGKNSRDFDYDESNIFSQYDLAGKYISDV